MDYKSMDFIDVQPNVLLFFYDNVSSNVYIDLIHDIDEIWREMLINPIYIYLVNNKENNVYIYI